jgi:hypothetical protein
MEQNRTVQTIKEENGKEEHKKQNTKILQKKV